MGSKPMISDESSVEHNRSPYGRAGIVLAHSSSVTIAGKNSRECEIFSRIRKTTASEVSQKVRDQVREIVAIECRRRGGAGVAIDYVANAIGASSAWVRRVFDGSGEASVHAHLMLNIEALLDAVMEREARLIEENRIKLRGSNAAVSSSSPESGDSRQDGDVPAWPGSGHMPEAYA